jgi:tetratricopeptide (TPR) repeat protein
MKTYLILLVSMALLFSLGCSKKIVVVKASPPDQNQSQTISAEKSNTKASDNHLRQAKQFYAQKRYKQARKHCEKAIDFNHRNWEAHYYLGLSLQRRKNYTISIEAFSVCLKYSPKNNFLKSEIHYAIGYNWEQMGHFNKAEREYAVALDFNPDNRTALDAKNRISIEKALKGWKKRKKSNYDG